MPTNYYSDVAGPTTPAKSGVRDCVRVPFTVLPGTALGAQDVIYLAKVSAGHRVVGYYIESPVASGAGATVTIRTNDPSLGASANTDLATSVPIGSAAGAAFGHNGSRTSTTSGTALTGTVTAGCIPSPVFGKDGTFELYVSAPGTSPSANVKISGYIEVQPA